MINKISISWNDEYQHDGFLYFAQRIVEMLDYMTKDINRAPVLNTCRLIDEYLQICNGEANLCYLDEVYSELLCSMRKDVVLQYKIGETRINQIINRLNKFPEKRKAGIEYLKYTIARKYLEWSKEYIKYIVPKNKEKRKCERAIRCFIPELFKYGYSREEIYHSAKQLLTEEINPYTALEAFLEQYNGVKRSYSVYVGIADKILVFEEILSKGLGIVYEDDGNFNKVEVRDGYSVIKMADVEALDASAAAEKAIRKIELFTAFYQYFGEYSENVIQNRVYTISKEGQERKLVVNRGKYKSIKADDPNFVGEMSEIVITGLINRATCSVNELEKIIKLHNRAISNNGLENGFLNLWSILEVICVSNPEKSKIEQVRSVVVPILKNDYLHELFYDINENIKKVLSQEDYNTLISDIEEVEDEYAKIACLILLPKYSLKLDDFVDCLTNYPVLRTRMLNLHDNYKKRIDIYNLTENYAQRVSWHLSRIYRARNSIVHSGKRPNDLKDLGEHLHSYVDNIINEIIIKLCIGSLGHISNVLTDSELQQENRNNYFKVNEAIDIEGINLIFSKKTFWYE